MTTQQFIPEKAKESYLRKESSTVKLLDSTFNYDKKVLLDFTVPNEGKYEMAFLSLYCCLLYFTPIIQHWQDYRVKDVCKTQREINIVGNVWQLRFTRP